MLLPSLVTAVIQEVGGETGCHNDPRLLRGARLYARLLRQTPFFVKKENRIRLTVDCRNANALFAAPPSVELLSGDGLSLIEVDSSGFLHGESLGLHCGCGDVAGCFHRMRLSGEIRHFFSAGQGFEQVPQDDRD